MENHKSDLGSIDRRHFERFDFLQNVIVERERFQTVPDVTAQNLSQRGACLRTKTSLEIGAIITAEIPTSKLHVIGEVRWVKSENNDNNYEVGILFHELFPQTKQQITDLIHQLRIEPVVVTDRAPLLHLENSIGSYLDKYVEEIKPDPIETYPTVRRRHGTTTETSFSVYTPSKSKSLELSLQSFRLEQPNQIRRHQIFTRRFILSLILIAVTGLYLFTIRQTMKNVYSKLQLVPSNSSVDSSVTIETNEIHFEQGTLDKLTWSGDQEHVKLMLTFRDVVTSDQIEYIRSTEYGQSQVIKIKNVQKVFDPKTISVVNPLVKQIRLGLHQNENLYELQVWVDLQDPTIEIVDREETEKTLTLDFMVANKI